MAAALESIPAFLFDEALPASGSEGAWAQVVKNFIAVHAGLHVNHSGDKSNAEQAVLALNEYRTWCDAIFKKYPNNKVQGYLAYTTATKKKEITGTAIMRYFKEAMATFGNRFNPYWHEVLHGQTSGKQPEDLWLMFCQRLEAEKNKSRKTPPAFSIEKVELSKWVLVFKHLGPPSEILYNKVPIPEIAAPTTLAMTGSGSHVRREQNLGRAHHRELQQSRRDAALLHARGVGEKAMMHKCAMQNAVQQAMDSSVEQM